MLLITDNHSFHYELENICRVFFPEEKITVCDTDGGVEDEIILTSLRNDGSLSLLRVEVLLGSQKLEKSDSLPVMAADSEKELMLASLLYKVLTELTGYRPGWGILTGVRPSKLMRSLIASEGEENAEKYFTDTLFVTPAKTRLAAEVARAEDKTVALSEPESFSLYVSIPFCPTRCSYCSFVSHSIANAGKLIPVYVDKLCEELVIISEIAEKLGLRLSTVYYGGGTPTTLDAKQLKKLTDTVGECFDTKNALEYTVEAGRPDTVTPEKLEVLKNAGVTRISINPQTFSDGVLREIGRRHTAEDTLNAFRAAREAGFDNINTDLIAGLPTDTRESFENTLNTALSLNPENITVHTLALKRSSSLVTDRQTALVAGMRTADMLEYADRNLRAGNYSPYYMYRQSRCIGNLENVGWARPGMECLYNIYMMEEIHTVLAAGGGAVTKLKNPYSTYIERIFNYKYPYEYINGFDRLKERKKRISDFYDEIRR